MRIAIDANIVLYAFADTSDPQKTDIARDLLLRLARASECVVSTQVLKEFASVCTKRLRGAISKELLLERLEQLAMLNLVTVNARLTALAVNRHYASRISFYDSLIVEAALAGGAEVLYSEDLQHGMRFDGLRVSESVSVTSTFCTQLSAHGISSRSPAGTPQSASPGTGGV